MNSPKISIVVAIYRPNHFLEEVIHSLRRQSYTDFEVLFSDDSESELAKELIARQNDSRFYYHRNPQTLGPCGNHLATINRARGEYVSILNQDDSWEPTFLETLLTPLDADKELSFSFCNHGLIDEKGNFLVQETMGASHHYGRSSLSPGKQTPLIYLLVNQTIPVAMGTLFRRSHFSSQLIPADAAGAYDFWMAYSLCRSNKSAFYIPESLSHWRTHPDSQTSTGNLKWQIGSALCWKAIASDPLLSDVLGIAKERARASYVQTSLAAIRQGEWRLSRDMAHGSLQFGYSLKGLALLGFATVGQFLRNRVHS